MTKMLIMIKVSTTFIGRKFGEFQGSKIRRCKGFSGNGASRVMKKIF